MTMMALNSQVEKVNYVEALGSRVNMIEASRQQSEARVREEVDASLGQKMGAIDQVGWVGVSEFEKPGIGRHR